MSSCDLVYGPPADLFRSMDSSENLNSSQGMHQRRDQSSTREPSNACTYTSTKKEDFWEHLRIHIKPEKMRTCPMCNFVTEHKQQLEYHVRNQMGSKPFKCEKCTYSCVTKSMLSTHMKSHSSVYQYNCADCDYATKYLYALKIHLRKLQHKPGKVLNPDGTINPEPVVDIYGTKRGPKPKKSKVDDPPVAQNRKNNKLRMIYPKMMSSGIIVPGQISPRISPMLSMLPMSPILTISPMGNHVNVGAINTLGINGINSLPYHVTCFINTMAVNPFISGTPSIDSAFVNGNVTAKEAIHENVINSGQTRSESPLNLKIPEGHCVQSNNKNIIKVPGMGSHRVPKYEVYHADEDVPLDLSKSGQTSHGS